MVIPVAQGDPAGPRRRTSGPLRPEPANLSATIGAGPPPLGTPRTAPVRTRTAPPGSGRGAAHGLPAPAAERLHHRHLWRQPLPRGVVDGSPRATGRRAKVLVAGA